MKEALKIQWAECIDEIKNHISSQQYDTWFACIAPSEFKENRLILTVPTLFVSRYIEEKYLDLMTRVINKVFGPGVDVVYQVGCADAPSAEESVAETGITDNSKAEAQTAQPTVCVAEFNSQLCGQYSFDNFIEGDSNRLARSVGQAIAMNPAKTFNPFFIYGPSGCGKTHLVNAIGQYTKQLHPEMRVLYMSAHLFYVQYANATKENKLPDFINFYQTIDMLIIDDVHELSGKTATQNTFFHIFNHLHLNNKQLIFTADRPPVEITGLEERLLTRFKWGFRQKSKSLTKNFVVRCFNIR